MKLTQVLHKQNFGRLHRIMWKARNKYVIAEGKIPPPLVARGIQPVDPVEKLMTPADVKPKVWIPPDDPRFMLPPREEDLPDYHEQRAYTFNSSVRLWEGVRQAQLLTNTVVNEGLPDRVQALCEKQLHPHQDHLIQRLILQSHLWDTTREKLPKRKKPDDISLMNYKAELGIPQARITSSLLYSLVLKLAQMSASSVHLTRYPVEDHRLHSHFLYNNSPIYITADSRVLLTSAKPLSSFADKTEVEQARSVPIPDIFPVAPTIDLENSHCYKDETSGLCPHHHHTLFLEFPREWSMDQRHASALLSSYAHCIAMVTGTGPVCVQTVHTDGELFGYTTFQLNSVSAAPDSPRNIAWVDSDRLFEKVIPRRAMLRNTQYRNYNPNVISKILAMYQS